MPVLVAESCERIVGWGALSSFRTAYTLAGTSEDSIYVHHDLLRQGIGSRLPADLIAADSVKKSGPIRAGVTTASALASVCSRLVKP
jgi:L-amino acid N-acyltransferase YncA